MPIDKLSGAFTIKVRDEIRDDYCRAYRFRVPGADTSPNTQPFVDASTFADGVAPLYFDASVCADAVSLLTETGQDLVDEGHALGVDKQGLSFSSGYMVVTAAVGGAAVNAGTEVKFIPTNQRFSTLVTDTYFDGDLVAIQALSTGPDANLGAGSLLTFTNPPPGIGGTATVFENSDGSGLTGGANAETDDEYRTRIFAHQAEPPAGGNEAAVCALAEAIPGIAVQKCFAYPAMLGPGTMGVAFTVRPAYTGASRVPNAVQLAQVEAALIDSFPGDDGIMVMNGSNEAVTVCASVTWRTTASAWADSAPWPAPLVGDFAHVTNAVAPTAASIRVTSSSTLIAPSVGQTIGLYDVAARIWRRKRIRVVGTVSASHTYDLAFDMTTLGASDLSFIPANGALVSPWSDSLQDVVLPVLSYFDKQGPSEVIGSFADPGRRQRRFPAPTSDAYPNKIENRMVDGLFPVVSDAVILAPTVPLGTHVGTPGVSWNIHTLGDLAVFAE